MLFKLLKKHNKVQFAPPPAPTEVKSPALRIIHAGGHMDSYYMAIPAKRVLERHPGFVIARPDVFRRPWDAAVLPEEILRPGQKFFLVPCRSLRKLQRRIRRPNPEFSGNVSGESFFDDDSYSSTNEPKPIQNLKGLNRRVRYVGIDKEENTKDLKKNLEGKRHVVTWHPSLTSIVELDTCDSNELLVNIGVPDHVTFSNVATSPNFDR